MIVSLSAITQMTSQCLNGVADHLQWLMDIQMGQSMQRVWLVHAKKMALQ
jgi:hypothetical protein